MKFTIEKTTKEAIEVEISLPCYRKGICHYYKIYSENKCIQVTDIEGWFGISLHPTFLALNNTTDSSEEEFLLIFDKIYYSLLRI